MRIVAATSWIKKNGADFAAPFFEKMMKSF
jgi:hypothetical protein